MNLTSSSIMKKTDSTTDTKFDEDVTRKGITWNQVKKLFNLLDDKTDLSNALLVNTTQRKEDGKSNFLFEVKTRNISNPC